MVRIRRAYTRKAKDMKRKDLVVGLDVAVKDGGRIYRAFILELNTQWTFQMQSGAFRLWHNPESTRVAVAEYVRLDKRWRPNVVECRHILQPWAEYEAELQVKQEAAERSYKEDQRQRDAYEKMRSRCAELLKITVRSPRLGVAEVQLNDLYAIACAMEKHTLRYDDTDQPSISSCMATDSDRAK